MKKITAILLCAAMTLGLMACGGGAASSAASTASSAEPKSEAASSEAAAPESSEAPAAETKSDYPNKTIQVIIPYKPGGGSDILTRAIMSTLKLPNNQVWAAINVDGAAGFTGCMQAFQASNDGYTILAHNPMDVAAYSLNGTDPQDMYKNLEMICTVVTDYNVFSTNKQTGWKSVDDVVAYVNEHPGEVKLAETGSTSISYANALMLLRELGIEDKVTIVPHDGGADCMTALMGNHVQLTVESSIDARAMVDSGDCIPLAVIGSERAQYLPDVPTTDELGLHVVNTKPRGYYAPPGTPQEAIDILADSIEVAIQQQEFIDTCANLGLEINFKRAEEIQPEIEAWADQLRPVFEEILAAG